MRNLQKIAANTNVMGVTHQIARHPGLWGEEGKGFFVRVTRDNVMTDQEDATREAPILKQRALGLMQMVEASELGPILVQRLDIGEKSEISYHLYYDRYYMVLDAGPGCLITSGDETTQILTGDIWWADPRKDCGLSNNSKDEVLLMFVDVRHDG